MSDLPILSASRAKDARACKRLHHIKYDLGYRPAVEDETLRFGSLMHAALEAWWDAAHVGEDRLEAALAALAAGEADPFDRARAEAMARGYDARWGQEQLTVRGVEVEFRSPLRNPQTSAPSRTWQLGGKIDAIAETPDGRVLLVEHKTAGEDVAPGTDYWKRLRIDGQVSVYFEGARALGLKPEAMLYDVLRKPALRPSQVPVLDDEGVEIVLDANGERVRTKDGKRWRRTGDSALGYVLQTRPETPEEYRKRIMLAIAEDPAAYFVRGEVVRLEAEMDEALYDLWSLAREVHEGKNADRFPRNPDACARYGRTCAFFACCTGEASLDDPSLFRRSTRIHPELAADAA